MKLMNKSKWLFKYMPFNLHTIKVIVNNQLWFGKPALHNDPNELEFIVKYDGVIKTAITYKFKMNDALIEVIKNTNSGKKLDRGYDKLIFEDCLKSNIKNHVGICSFSTKRDDILMWSHYADANKGICLVFNKDKLINNLNINVHGEMDYDENMPNGKFDNDKNYGILKADKGYFIHKFENWGYEAEYRFVKLYDHLIEIGDSERLISFTPDCLEGIIIGEKYSDNNIEVLKNLSNNRADKTELNFWRCEKNIYKRKMRVYYIGKELKNKRDISLSMTFRKA